MSRTRRSWPWRIWNDYTSSCWSCWSSMSRNIWWRAPRPSRTCCPPTRIPSLVGLALTIQRCGRLAAGSGQLARSWRRDLNFARFTTLLGTLQRHGLATENDSAPEVLEELSKDLVKQVNQQAGQMQRSQQAKPVILRETRVRSVQPSWSPTELGETILSYYRLAGEEEITDALGRGQPEGLSHRSQVLIAVWPSSLVGGPVNSSGVIRLPRVVWPGFGRRAHGR